MYISRHQRFPTEATVMPCWQLFLAEVLDIRSLNRSHLLSPRALDPCLEISADHELEQVWGHITPGNPRRSHPRATFKYCVWVR